MHESPLPALARPLGAPLAWLALAASVHAQDGAAYDYELYTEASSAQSFNVEVTRGMVLSPDGQRLFALQSYGSSVVEFDLSAGAAPEPIEPVRVWPTLPGPVAIAWSHGRLYVLGQGTHALACHDPDSGRFLDVYVPDPPVGAGPDASRGFSEPGDLAIDTLLGQAYVSCMGSDAVHRIDISQPVMVGIESWRTGSDAQSADFLLKRPRFLHWDGRSLWVAPFLSGNNTMNFMEGVENHAVQGSGHSGSAILDGRNPAHLVGGGLPDVDLVRITPGVPGAAVVEPVLRGVATLLTGHGVHPTSGEVWMLGIDSLNLSADTEPDLRGHFSRNVLARRRPVPSGAGQQLPLTLNPGVDLTDLDLPGSVAGYDAARALAFPYALAFGGPRDLAAIGSSTLSRVALRRPDGSHAAFVPPAGAPPADWSVVRDLQFVGQGQAAELWIYCQQTGEIVVWPVPNGIPAPAEDRRYSLLSDPTPAAIARGRGIFYDATRSEHGRSTCATCHPGGGSDLLAWSLRDEAIDHKDPMLTQPLKGLRESFPFHWRGERDIHAFNGAFTALLGAARPLGTASPGLGSERADFEAFLFSLRPAANGRALLTRRLPDTTSVPGEARPALGSPQLVGAPAVYPGALPANGQAKFLGSTCNTCHMLPTGSVGSFAADNELSEVAQTARNVHLETIQLHNFLQARDQAMVTVTSAANGRTLTRPFLGAGTQHSGGRPSIYQFFRARFPTIFARGSGAGVELGAADGAAFVLCLDTGTSPAAHHAVMLNRIGTKAALDEIEGTLLEQARRGWIDVVVHGASDRGGGQLRDLSWLYDARGDAFVPSDGGAPMPLAHFALLAPPVNHLRQNVFLGVPPGTGRRLALDYDGDLLPNHLEPGLNAWRKDRDGDGFPDGHETDGDPGTPDQGDPDDPAVTSLAGDQTPPALALGSGFEAILVRASHAEFSFEATEDVEWVLTAQPGSGVGPGSPQSVQSAGTGFARRHTAHLHGLRFSTSYTVTLTLRDRAGRVASVPLSGSGGVPSPLITLPQRGGQGGAPLRERALVRSFDVEVNDAQPTGSGRRAVFRLSVGDAEDPHHGPLNDWTVIAQVVTQDPGTGRWSIVPVQDLVVTGALNAPTMGQPTPLPTLWMGGAYPVAPFHPGQPPAANPGPLLVLQPTGQDGVPGETSVLVRTLGTGSDPIALTVVEILRTADNLGSPPSPRYMLPGDFKRWVLPATEEGLRMGVAR